MKSQSVFWVKDIYFVAVSFSPWLYKVCRHDISTFLALSVPSQNLHSTAPNALLFLFNRQKIFFFTLAQAASTHSLNLRIVDARVNQTAKAKRAAREQEKSLSIKIKFMCKENFFWNNLLIGKYLQSTQRQRRRARELGCSMNLPHSRLYFCWVLRHEKKLSRQRLRRLSHFNVKNWMKFEGDAPLYILIKSRNEWIDERAAFCRLRKLN